MTTITKKFNKTYEGHCDKRHSKTKSNEKIPMKALIGKFFSYINCNYE